MDKLYLYQVSIGTSISTRWVIAHSVSEAAALYPGCTSCALTNGGNTILMATDAKKAEATTC